jgi:hypothetical protein
MKVYGLRFWERELVLGHKAIYGKNDACDQRHMIMMRGEHDYGFVMGDNRGACVLGQ